MTPPVAGTITASVFLLGNNAAISTPEELPEGTQSSINVSLHYVNEGGANVIYNVTTHKDDNQGAIADVLRQLMTSKVLRVRKEQEALAATTQRPPRTSLSEANVTASPTWAVYSYFHERVEPLIPPENLLQHNLIRVSPGLVDKLNAALQDADSSRVRPRGRSGSRLDTEDPFAMLLENMIPTPGRSVTLELKPKWLSDSPNTANLPRSRCRTCALRAMRDAGGKKEQHAGSRTEVCPLVWTRGRDDAKQEAVDELFRHHGLPGDPLWAAHGESIAAVLKEELVHGSAASLLQRLASVTAHLDTRGVVDVAADGTEQEWEDLALAMTLRDCTLFVNFTWDSSELPRFKLADLDRKDWKTKTGRWQEIEQDLVSGGWYTDTKLRQRGAHDADDEVCLLWHQHGADAG